MENMNIPAMGGWEGVTGLTGYQIHRPENGGLLPKISPPTQGPPLTLQVQLYATEKPKNKIEVYFSHLK